ncbi:hypothetical protein DV708_16550 [Aeromonas veronii]|nr:hypothetical protein DV708_16550 [Aeromonas veronii]
MSEGDTAGEGDPARCALAGLVPATGQPAADRLGAQSGHCRCWWIRFVAFRRGRCQRLAPGLLMSSAPRVATAGADDPARGTSAGLVIWCASFQPQELGSPESKVLVYWQPLGLRLVPGKWGERLKWHYRSGLAVFFEGASRLGIECISNPVGFGFTFQFGGKQVVFQLCGHDSDLAEAFRVLLTVRFGWRSAPRLIFVHGVIIARTYMLDNKHEKRTIDVRTYNQAAMAG